MILKSHRARREESKRSVSNGRFGFYLALPSILVLLQK